MSCSRVSMGVVLLVLFLSGCADYWAKPGGTPVAFAAARDMCTRQAEAQFPPSMQPVMIAPGTPAPVATRCAPVGGSVACTTVGTGFSPPTYTTLDQNTGPREQAFRACLTAAGWRATRSEQEAAAITNSAP